MQSFMYLYRYLWNILTRLGLILIYTEILYSVKTEPFLIRTSLPAACVILALPVLVCLASGLRRTLTDPLTITYILCPFCLLHAVLPDHAYLPYAGSTLLLMLHVGVCFTDTLLLKMPYLPGLSCLTILEDAYLTDLWYGAPGAFVAVVLMLSLAALVRAMIQTCLIWTSSP